MFRNLSNGLAAVGLAAVIALVALMSGTAGRPAEAAPGPITLAPASSASCTTGFVASIPAADGTQTSVTFSATPAAAGTFSAATVPLSAGAASTTFTLAAGYTQATIIATSGTMTSNAATVSANCGTTNPCLYSNCGTCDPLYSVNCGANCYYGTIYTCGTGTCYTGVYNCGNTCGVYTGCGTACGVYTGCATGCGVYTGVYNSCNACVGNGVYTGAYNSYNTCNGCATSYYNTYGCANQCVGIGYLSCTPATCGNISGAILNCSNSYTPAGNLQYVPGRVSILPSASTIACGGATAITVTVTDPNGFKVPDGTTVNFTTTLGYIQATDTTSGGTAVGSLTIPPGTSGNAQVTASAGGQSANTTINVTCATGAPVVAVQTLPTAPTYPFPFPVGPRPSILPPATGDAGLAAS